MPKDMWGLRFLQGVLCEVLGPTFFLSTSLASRQLWPNDRVLADETPRPDPLLPTAISRHDLPPEHLSGPFHVSLANGMSLTIRLACFGPAVHGGVHLNPVVTLALAAGLRISPWKAILYVGGCKCFLGPSEAGACTALPPGGTKPGKYSFFK